MHEHCVPAGALHQRADRGTVGCTGDQISFPMPRLEAVRHGSGTLVDHRHSSKAPRGAGIAPGVPTPSAPPGTQCQAPVLPEYAVTGVDGLVDALVTQLPRHDAGKRGFQGVTDLLRAPRLVEHLIDRATQDLVRAQPTLLRPRHPGGRQALSQCWPVPPACLAVTSNFTADRCGRAAEFPRDGPQTHLRPQPVGDE